MLRADPATARCDSKITGHELCFLVDQGLDADDGTSRALGDSREVTEQQATALLGYDAQTALDGARRRLADLLPAPRVLTVSVRAATVTPWRLSRPPERSDT